MNKYNLRGIMGVDFGDKQIKNFAKRVVSYVYTNKLKPCVIIAKDNRESGDYVLSLINSVLLKYGIEINYVGLAPTPALVFLTKKFKLSLGIMITASHNLKEYNGVKVFNKFGESVDVDKFETKKIKYKQFGRIIDFSKFKEVYVRDVKNRLNPNSIKCVFDCANGVVGDIVRRVFPRQQIIGDDASGKYVNDGYGSQCLDNVKKVCKRNKKIGFAFDGDGDRVVAVDENGEVIDGDKILYILSTQMLGYGDKVVGTQISSLGLEVSLRRLGVGLIRERVGAKYVAKRMKNECVVLGGEPCGHIFVNSNISDGIAVAVEVLNILNRTGLTFAELLKGYKKMFVKTKDVKLENVSNVEDYEEFVQGVRVVVRQSGTEDVLRIFVEGSNEDDVEKAMLKIVKRVSKV